MSSHAPTTENVSSIPEGVTDSDYKPLPGRLGNLTRDQQTKLDELRKILQDEGIYVEGRMDDAVLLRFLRARKFAVAEAKKMIIDCEQWRKDKKVAEVLSFDFTEKEAVDKIYPQYYHKMDKEGRPVYIERLGQLDIPGLYAVTTQDRLLQRLIYEYEKFIIERLPACSKAVGHPVETSCTILDLKNVSLSNFVRVREYLREASSIGQNRYPETMGKFYVVNAPYLFSTVWAVIKPWLDPVTVSKIEICGSDYKGKLLAQIPAENLPKEFGGTCSCPGGCSLSDAGPWNRTTTPPTA